ncbi:hypothetical protein [Photobacterium leiognathi]|uniref:hypothetical protein n=1 Tax=Photobacterium leiognathi TaxID=553611 RepID=UPI002982B0C9|nr:hypothetical protein [Photobacterium leiognathi]
MLFGIEMLLAVVFFIVMVTRNGYLKPTWQQLVTLGLQIASVWCLIHLFISHVYPEFVFAKDVISVFFSAVFVFAALKDRYESDVSRSHHQQTATK